MLDPSSSVPHAGGNPEPIPYCSFCLREHPERDKFYAYHVANSSRIRAITEDIFGFELDSDNFTVCTPCWKVVQLVENFRMCCFKANLLAKTTGGAGLKVEDDWFSDWNEEAIDRVREAIGSHVGKLEGCSSVTGGDENRSQSLLTTEIKIEPEEADEYNESEASQDDTGHEKLTLVEESSKRKSESNTDLPNPNIDDSNLIAVQCENCRRFFDSTIGLKIHQTSCKTPVEETEPFPYPCHLCPVSFVLASSLKSHLNKHSGTRPFECRARCDKRFYNKNVRKEHESSCCAAKEYKCTICETKFGTNNAMKRHMKAVHVEPTLPCEICGMMFKTIFNRKRHTELKHSENEGNYPCTVCGRRFKLPYTMRSHRETHYADLPGQFPCTQCDRMFTKRRSLAWHMSKQHDELRCDSCGKKFFRRKNLLKHVETNYCKGSIKIDKNNAAEETQTEVIKKEETLT